MTNSQKHWLAGFIDAQGNFQVFRKKVVNTKKVITHYGVGLGFHLGLHIRDYALLQQIQSWLGGIGNLYKYTDKNEAHYAITSIAHLKSFIEVVLDPCTLLTTRQSERAQLLAYCVMNGIRRVETLGEFEALLQLAQTFPTAFREEAFSYPYGKDLYQAYILGFINGDGSFTDVTRYGGGKFALEHTDENMVKLIHSLLGLSTSVYAPTVRGKRKQTYAFSVTSSKDLFKVHDFVERNAATTPLRGHKAVQFSNWAVTLTRQEDKLWLEQNPEKK